MSSLPQVILRTLAITSALLMFLSSSVYALPALQPQGTTNPQSNSTVSPTNTGPASPNSTSTQRIDNNQKGIVEASTARVALTIIDQKNSPIEKAKVTLDKKEAITDKAGLAIFTGIQPGQQAVEINKSGKITSALINVANQKDTSLTQRFTIKAQTPFKLPLLLIAGILIIGATLLYSYLMSIKS